MWTTWWHQSVWNWKHTKADGEKLPKSRLVCCKLNTITWIKSRQTHPLIDNAFTSQPEQQQVRIWERKAQKSIENFSAVRRPPSLLGKKWRETIWRNSLIDVMMSFKCHWWSPDADWLVFEGQTRVANLRVIKIVSQAKLRKKAYTLCWRRAKCHRTIMIFLSIEISFMCENRKRSKFTI